ncbi:hypothetical protein ACI2UK_24435 [Ralstonia nicotianae]|uniref:hypothetical protein n=1 Tax=Ralstonia pseudosolanacearum TaxID=1310165 RepID=UPI0020030374|nr:hypothetical protein [Ralstonia pseudosolanacearum]MCK4120410.1 hypothetical protein [Ralstonia pseudosolanacearum]
MNIEMSGSGKVAFNGTQQRWVDTNGGDGRIMQIAMFAGQEMTAIADDAGGFDLRFLNFKSGGFPTMEAAKQAAPDFARRVFARLIEMIAD